MEHPFRHHLNADDWSQKEEARKLNHPKNEIIQSQNHRCQQISIINTLLILNTLEQINPDFASPLLKFHESNLFNSRFNKYHIFKNVDPPNLHLGKIGSGSFLKLKCSGHFGGIPSLFSPLTPSFICPAPG